MKTFRNLSKQGLYRIVSALKGNKQKTISIIGEKEFTSLSAWQSITHPNSKDTINDFSRDHLEGLVNKCVENWGTPRLQRTVDKILLTDE